MQSSYGKLGESHISGGRSFEHEFDLNIEINGPQICIFRWTFVSSRYIHLYAGPCKTRVSVSIAYKTKMSNVLKKFSDVRTLRDEFRFAWFPGLLSRTPHLRCFPATARLGTMTLDFSQR